MNITTHNTADPILPAKVSLDNILGSRTRSDQHGQRKSYVDLDFEQTSPQPKRRKNDALYDHEYLLNDFREHHGHRKATPRLEGHHKHHQHPITSHDTFTPRTSTDPPFRYRSEKDDTCVPEAQQIVSPTRSIVEPLQARQPLNMSSAGRRSAPLLTPTSLPPGSPYGHTQGPQEDIDLSLGNTPILQSEERGEYDYSALHGPNEVPHTSASALPTRPKQVAFKRESVPVTVDHGPDLIDLTSNGIPSIYEAQLTHHIEQNAVIIFSPQPPYKARPRIFAMCNTLEKFFAQALQGKIFSQQGNLGRLLEVKIYGVGEPVGISEGDDEDFRDFVDVLKQAACWKKTDLGIEGECKVDVRLKTL
jgi:hypothetical protein